MTPIIIGFSVNGWNVYRALRQGGIAAVALDNEPDSIFWHHSGPKPIAVSALHGEPLLAALRELASDGKPYVVISAVEDAVHFLNANRDRVPPNVLLDFPEPDVVNTLLDKKLFYLAAVGAGCSIYPMWFVNPDWTVAGGLGQVLFPCIVKTRTKMYVNGLAKAYRVDDAEALERVLAGIRQLPGLQPDALVIQKWVAGGDDSVLFCMQYYDRNHEPLASFVGRKIRQWPPRVGGTSSACPHKDDEVLEQTTKFFRSVRMRGLCSMEFKRSSEDGRLSMIEPTACRADYQEGTAVANGCNLPLIMYRSLTGAPLPQVAKPSQPVMWLHVGPDYQSGLKQGLTRLQWLRTIAGPKSYAVYDPADTGPISELIRRKLQAKLRRK